MLFAVGAFFADGENNLQGTAGFGIALALGIWRIYEMWIASRQKVKKDDVEITREEIATRREATKADSEAQNAVIKRWEQYADRILNDCQRSITGLQQAQADLQKKFDAKIKDEQDCRIRVAHLEARIATLEGHTLDETNQPRGDSEKKV